MNTNNFWFAHLNKQTIINLFHMVLWLATYITIIYQYHLEITWILGFGMGFGWMGSEDFVADLVG